MALVVKNLPANAGDARGMGLIPGSGRSLRVGSGNPLQYSCLKNSIDKRSLVGDSPWSLKESDTASTHIPADQEDGRLVSPKTILLRSRCQFLLYSREGKEVRK